MLSKALGGRNHYGTHAYTVFILNYTRCHLYFYTDLYSYF